MYTFVENGNINLISEAMLYSENSTEVEVESGL